MKTQCTDKALISGYKKLKQVLKTLDDLNRQATHEQGEKFAAAIGPFSDRKEKAFRILIARILLHPKMQMVRSTGELLSSYMDDTDYEILQWLSISYSDLNELPVACMYGRKEKVTLIQSILKDPKQKVSLVTESGVESSSSRSITFMSWKDFIDSSPFIISYSESFIHNLDDDSLLVLIFLSAPFNGKSFFTKYPEIEFPKIKNFEHFLKIENMIAGRLSAKPFRDYTVTYNDNFKRKGKFVEWLNDLLDRGIIDEETFVEASLT